MLSPWGLHPLGRLGEIGDVIDGVLYLERATMSPARRCISMEVKPLDTDPRTGDLANSTIARSVPRKRRSTIEVGGQFHDELLGVDSCSVDEARLASTQERASDQEHAGRIDDTSVVPDHPLAI
jgi:hypothetical protein